MKLFGYELNKVSKPDTVVRGNRFIPNMFFPWYYGREWIKTTDQTSLLKAYRSWVYIASSFNATKFAATTLRLYAGKRSSGQKLLVPSKKLKTAQQERLFKTYGHLKAVRRAQEFEEITEHPFLDLLDNVNGFMNRNDLFELSELYQELTGDCYWYLAPGPLGIPEEIWPIPPDRMYIVPDPKEFISHYIYSKQTQSGVSAIVPGADKVVFTKDEIVHFKFPNPNDFYHGASPLQAIADAYNINANMNTFENNMFSNQLVSPGYFRTIAEPGKTSNRALNDPDFEEVRTAVKEVWTGVKNAGHTGLLDNIEFVPINTSPKEMSYLQGRKWTKAEIYSAYGVPEALFDPSANRANADTAEYIHSDRTMTPRLRRFEQKLNERVMPIYDEKLFVTFDSVVQEEKDFNLRKEESRLRSGVWSINQVLQQNGEDAIDGGDTHFIPMGQIPLDMAELGIEATNAGVAEPKEPAKVMR